MITGLTILIAAVVVSVCAIFALYGRGSTAPHRSGSVLAAILITVVAVSVGIYSHVGRYSEWQDARVNVNIDPRLAAKITEARRTVADNPHDLNAKKELARLYMQGGMFNDSVLTLTDVIAQSAESASLLGLKAKAMYYRDKREMTPSVKETLQRALALYPAEPVSRMLMAEHAFRNNDYATAVKEWTVIIEAHSAPAQEKAIQFAISRAREKLAQ